MPLQRVSSVDDYGYRSSGPTYNDEYVVAPILTLCRSLDVKRILDVGCGNGELCRRLAKAGFEVIGCDPSETGIRIAQESVPEVTFKRMGVYDDPRDLDRPPFDVVVAMEVVEHLHLPRKLPQFARVVLRESGHLIITTPYHGYAKNLVLSILNKWDHHLSPLWDGGHIKMWSYRTLRELVESEGFMLQQFKGVGRLPLLWKSMVMVFRRGDGRPDQRSTYSKYY